MTSPWTSRVRLLAGSAAGGLALAAVAAVPFASPASAAPVAPADATGAVPSVASAAFAPAAARPQTTTRVSNQLQLRRAVAKANQRPGLDQVDLTRSIALSKGNGTGSGALTLDIDVTDDLVLNGGGNTINGRAFDRVLDVAPGTRLELNFITIRNGAPAVATESGGLIRVTQGQARLGRVTLAEGDATGDDLASGGAVMNDGGRVAVVNSEVRMSTASRAGGGIEANGGTTVLRGSRLTGNQTGPTPGNGGGLHLTGEGSVQVAGSTVSGNSATAEGGGLWNSATGTMSVRDSVVSGNSAAGAEATNGGGGIYNDGGTLRLIAGNVSNNQATGTAGSGGGILNVGGSLDASQGALIANNSAQRAGGGIEATAGSTTTLADSDLVANTAGAAPGNGGGLHLTGAGTVDITAAEVRGNTASAEGGGLWNSAAGTMTVRDSLVNANVAQGVDATQGGGGLFQEAGGEGSLTASGLTVTNNRATGTAGSGGGLLNDQGTVTVSDSTFSGNQAVRAGGAIEANVGSTTLTDTDLTGNSTGAAPGNGGGLHLTGAGTVDVTGGAVDDNTATAEGGGLWNSATGTMNVSGTTFDANSAAGAEATNGGGALYNDGGALTVEDATLIGNQATGAAGSGGGILNVGGTLTVSGSTLSTNDAARAGGAIETAPSAMGAPSTVDLSEVVMTGNTTGAAPGNGGALHITGAGAVTYAGGEVTGNDAANQGGGLWNSATATMTVTDVAVTGNTAPTSPNAYQDGETAGGFTINGQVVPTGNNPAEYPNP